MVRAHSGVGGWLRIVIVIINDWIYERKLKKIIMVKCSFDESTALWLQTTNKRAKSFCSITELRSRWSVTVVIIETVKRIGI